MPQRYVCHEGNGKLGKIFPLGRTGVDESETAKLKKEYETNLGYLAEATRLIKGLYEENLVLQKQNKQLQDAQKKIASAKEKHDQTQKQHDKKKVKSLSKRIKEFQARHSGLSRSKVTVGEWDPVAKRWKP